jgi:hypothetical protein
MSKPRPHSPSDPAADTLFGRLRAVGVQPVGAALLAFGTVLVLASFTIFNWFREGPGFFAGAGSQSTFSDLHNLLDATQRRAEHLGIAKHVSFGVSLPYFTWLGWVLLLAAVVLGALAVSPVGARVWAVKWLAAVVAAAGAATTFWALNLVTFERNAPNNANAPDYAGFLGHSGLGAWAAIAGFVVILVAALVPHER